MGAADMLAFMRAVGFAMILCLSGCLGAPTPATATGTVASAVQTPSVEVTWINISIRGAATTFDGEPNGGNIIIPANTTLALSEARWTCTAGPCELTLVMINPTKDGGAQSQGNKEAQASVEKPVPGKWNVQVKPVTVIDAVGQIRVSAFVGGAAPAGYSAFAS